jgi:DNA-binding NarL/FixJ family response regulator
MLGHPRRRESSALARLSAREREVLEQMAAGRSNPAIGQALFLSVSAVEKHVSAIFTKLGLVEERSSHRRVAAVLAYLADS